MRIILGIDPGLTKTGWAIIGALKNQLSFVAADTIYTDNKESLARRITTLHQEITRIISIYQPTESAIEEIFINNNPASSLKLGHARGALMLSLALAGLKVYEYSSTAVKKTVVGVGRADKKQIGFMVKLLLPKAKLASEDEADAAAIAICHYHHTVT